MFKISIWLVALGACGSLAYAREPGDPDSLTLLPWGAALSAPVLSEANPLPPVTAVALGPDGDLWLLDAGSHRALRFRREGALVQALEIGPGHIDDLAVASDGRVALLDTTLRRIRILDPSGGTTGELALSPLVTGVRRIAFGPGDSLEIENAHGERFSLGAPEAPRSFVQASLERRRGPSGSSLDCGVQVEDGRVLLFRSFPQTNFNAGRRPPQQVERLPLQGVASARLLSACGEGGVLLLLERLTASNRVEVTQEVVWVRDGQVSAPWIAPTPALFHPSRPFARRGPDVLLVHPAADGLEIWRWRLP